MAIRRMAKAAAPAWRSFWQTQKAPNVAQTYNVDGGNWMS
jgi:hypothetical protein